MSPIHLYSISSRVVCAVYRTMYPLFFKVDDPYYREFLVIKGFRLSKFPYLYSKSVVSKNEGNMRRNKNMYSPMHAVQVLYW